MVFALLCETRKLLQWPCGHAFSAFIQKKYGFCSKKLALAQPILSLCPENFSSCYPCCRNCYGRNKTQNTRTIIFHLPFMPAEGPQFGK